VVSEDLNKGEDIMTARLWTLMVVLLTASAGLADILHGIPGGDATILPDGIDGPVNDQYGMPAGWWSSYRGWSGADVVQATGTGDDRHIEISPGWFGESAATWYVDYGSTPTDQAWIISADLKWMGGGTNTTLFSLYADEGGSIGTIGMSFTGTSVGWGAGSMSGTFTSATGLTSSYQTVSFEYDPVTGAAKGMLGSEVIFDVTTDTGLTARRVQFSNAMAGNPNYDVSRLHIDNVTSMEVPEPATMGLLAAGGLGVLFRRKR
jgi:hypothetical protein